VDVLGNSLGARIALELARRGRALSVVSIAPPGSTSGPSGSSRAPAWRSRGSPAAPPRPWSASPEEAIGAREGFADSRDWWCTLLSALLLDVPQGLGHIDCPVLLVQGTADWIAMGQTVRYLPFVPRSRFRPLLAAGHAPQSDRPDTIVRLVERTAQHARDADAAGTLPSEIASSATGTDGAVADLTATPRRSGRRSGTARSTSPR
jgi:pimeloyl-ACP methyl ester carboxylesterase